MLLVAGLWPFNVWPRNNVRWLPTQNGILLGHNASVVGSGVFVAPNNDQEARCSLEIWFRPFFEHSDVSRPILAFYTRDNPFQFRLTQYLDQVLVRREFRDLQNQLHENELAVPNVFLRNEATFLTVTASSRGTSAYRNGIFVDIVRKFDLTCASFSGQLVLGSSPAEYASWEGTLLGFAIYDQELTREDVARHYLQWTQHEASLSRTDQMLAFYLFDEHSGRIVHNQVPREPDLYIPAHFQVPQKKILAAPWKEFTPDLNYVFDLLINIGGFLPFGFFTFAVLNWDQSFRSAATKTIVCGAFLSLAIECLQGLIPSRQSGITDIITNTLGTYLGLELWRCRILQPLATKWRARFPPARPGG
jgi:VanZ family protein